MEATSYNRNLLFNLLREMAAANKGEPIQISSDDEPLGVFFPFRVPEPKAPPARTPEQEEEFQLRLQNIDDAVTAEEMIEMIKEDLRSSSPKP